MSEAETRHESYKKGAWSQEEDEKLKRAVEELGDKNWVKIERLSGLARPAKNCRLRWFNYLRPNLKKFPFTKQEEDFIFQLHAKYGNSWSRIASELPGRSDNEIKNFWHKRAKKREREELRLCPSPKQKKQNQNQNHTNCSNHTLYQVPPTIPQSQSTQTNFLFSEASSPSPFPFCSIRPPQPPILSSLHQLSPPFLSPVSSQQMHCPSPLQLKLSPQVVAQFNSPNAPPFSPLNLHLSMPASSESCLPIQDSVLELNSSSPAFPSRTMEEDSPPTQTIAGLQGQLPSIQFNPPQASGGNSYMHEADSQSNLEIIDQLRKAHERVRFLKKKLRQRGISNKRNLYKHLFIKSPEQTDLLTTQVPLDINSSRMKEITEKNSRRKDGIEDLQVKSTTNLQEREKSESGECVQESIDTKISTHGENSDSKASLEKGFEREEDSIDEIFKMKNSETFPEQSRYNHHVNSQCNVIGPEWDLWNECSSSLLQELEGDLLGERYQIDEPFSPKRQGDALGAVYSQSSATTLAKPGDVLQELEGDLVGKRSQIDKPFRPKRQRDALDAVYSQGSAMTLAKPGDESSQLSYGTEYFKCSLGQEFSDELDIRFPDSNLGAESLPVHQNTEVDLVECSNLASQPMPVHESHHFSLPTSGEYSAPTQLCQPSIIQHQYHEAQQYSLDEIYGGVAEPSSGEETWKQELMEGLVADNNIWAEDETFFLDRFDFIC